MRTRDMKVGYVVENFGQISETFVYDLALGISASGIKIEILHDKDPDETSFSHNSDPQLNINKNGYASSYSNITNVVSKIGRMVTKYDLGFTLRRHLAHRAFTDNLRQIKPNVIYIDHGNNAILARSAIEDLEIPYAVHFHGRDASQLLGNNEYRIEIQKVFQSARCIVVASDHIRRRLVLAGCPARKIEKIRYGVNVENFEEVNWEERRRIAPSIIQLGRLVEKKNPIALLYAFAAVKSAIPDAKLTFVGDGPLRQELIERARLLGLADSIAMKGALPHQQALEELQHHLICAQHCVTDSRGDQEGFNISFLEAAASGLPVVSTYHDGIPENVVHGVTGYLVSEYDYESMAEVLRDLLLDREAIIRMGQSGRDLVKKNYDQKRRVKAIVSLLRDIAE